MLRITAHPYGLFHPKQPIRLKNNTLKFSLYILTIFFGAALLCLNCLADENSHLNELVINAQKQGLANDPTWLRLIQIDQTDFGEYKGRPSKVISEEFFLAESGRNNPQDELNSTLRAFFLPHTDHPEKHALCRFPARFLWLDQKLQLPKKNLPVVSCENFKTWIRNNSINSVSLVFATGYLGNPASYYGHVLLKLNGKDRSSKTTLLDTSINYGAIVPDGEDPISYIAKGLFGGYDAGFTHIEYYHHTHNYGNNELRDLWEYELNLSSYEKDLLIAHLWEVLGKKYIYYFLDENCAYRMAKSLELIPGIRIIESEKYWISPQEVFQKVARTHRAQGPLVKQIIYLPSRQSNLFSKHAELNTDEKSTLEEAVRSPEHINNERFQHSELTSKHRILDTLIDYYQFRGATKQDADAPLKEKYQKTLSKRYELPPGDSGFSKVTPDIESGPHTGRPTSRIALSQLHNHIHGASQRVTLRPAYYDQLDAEAGHVSNASLAMAEISIKVHDDSKGSKVRLDYLDLINILSLHTKATHLPGDSNFAWKLKAGVLTHNLECEECLTPRIELGGGYSMSVRNKVTAAAFMNAAIQDKSHGYGNSFVGPSAFMIVGISDNLRLLGEMGYRRYFDGKVKEDSTSRVAMRYRLSREWDARISYQYNQTEEFELSAGFYF